MVHEEYLKVAVVTSQQVPNGMCLYMTLYGMSQASNESLTFNDDTVCGALEYF